MTLILPFEAKTNNGSEGWHNRFRLLVSKAHPDLYVLMKQLRKEQGDTEIAVVERLKQHQKENG